jgi:hypothetical protein
MLVPQVVPWPTMTKRLSEIITEKLHTPEVHAKLWQAIRDAEASGDPKIVKQAKRLRRQREALDRQFGLTPPDE